MKRNISPIGLTLHPRVRTLWSALAEIRPFECAAEAEPRPALEHDPEKWVPVFRKDRAQIEEIERDDDSKKRHPALVSAPGVARQHRVARRAAVGDLQAEQAADQFDGNARRAAAFVEKRIELDDID